MTLHLRELEALMGLSREPYFQKFLQGLDTNSPRGKSLEPLLLTMRDWGDEFQQNYPDEQTVLTSCH